MMTAAGLAAALAALALPALADGVQTGVFVNSQEDGLMKELHVCSQSSLLVEGFVRRDIDLQEVDGTTRLVLNSNGVFTFDVVDEGAALKPADDFTREWGTTGEYRLDPARSSDC
ncbi:hypothetical protein [Rhodovulum sp. MB263]|uniref:hypothetical protein n=2 Tax=unclassified Rhodovulum TaxID=2631432 RepID=UPI0012DB6218|nr:hypothetical protein [Rhodovulum sp. MB263]